MDQYPSVNKASAPWRYLDPIKSEHCKNAPCHVSQFYLSNMTCSPDSAFVLKFCTKLQSLANFPCFLKPTLKAIPTEYTAVRQEPCVVSVMRLQL
jgi:hypothetical protein